ncbi:MAG: ABC transporter permease [Anaerolineales bacterium]|nr:ABC transporter permease [Anaerolineales bacterium]
MIADILTVMWKEIKEMPYLRGGLRGGKLGLLIFVGVLGIFMPVQSGAEFVSSPVTLLYWAWVPFLLVSSVIADSFAGERERHTLETLLAGRLSDRAILFGKIAAAIFYGWGLTLGCIVIGLVTVNVAHGKGHLLLYPPVIAIGIVVLPFLLAWMASGMGVLVSLRASTVRQAQQAFSIGFLALFLPLFLIPVLPEDLKMRMAQAVMTADIDVNAILKVAIAVILLLDCALVAAAMARFRRARLILD